MNIYIPLGLFLAILCFAFYKDKKNAPKVFLLSMLIACIFAMIRYNFGPDYFNYHEIFDGVQGEDLNDYVGRGMSVEILFLRLLQMFPLFTYFVVFLTVFWVGVNALFLWKYIPYKYFSLVILYFFLKTDYFLDSLVAMRTTLCAAIFLIAVYFLTKKKRLIYAALIVFASLFHTSAIALLPLALLTTNKKSFLFDNIVLWGIGIVALAALLIGHNFLIESLSSFVMDNVDELQRYSERDVASIGQSFNTLIFRVMSLSIMFYLAKSGEKEEDPKMIVFYKIAVIAAMLNLVMGQSLINDRYFLILNPIYILCIVNSFKRNPVSINTIITLFVFVIAIYIFYNKFSKPYFVSFLEYKTIFSATYIP